MNICENEIGQAGHVHVTTREGVEHGAVEISHIPEIVVAQLQHLTGRNDGIGSDIVVVPAKQLHLLLRCHRRRWSQIKLIAIQLEDAEMGQAKQDAQSQAAFQIVSAQFDPLDGRI